MASDPDDKWSYGLPADPETSDLTWPPAPVAEPGPSDTVRLSTGRWTSSRLETTDLALPGGEAAPNGPSRPGPQPTGPGSFSERLDALPGPPDGLPGSPDALRGSPDALRGSPDALRGPAASAPGLPDSLPSAPDGLRGAPDGLRGAPDGLRGVPDALTGPASGGPDTQRRRPGAPSALDGPQPRPRRRKRGLPGKNDAAAEAAPAGGPKPGRFTGDPLSGPASADAEETFWNEGGRKSYFDDEPSDSVGDDRVPARPSGDYRFGDEDGLFDDDFDEAKETQGGDARRNAIEWAVVLVGAVLLALLLRAVLLQAFWIPSPSMESTLLVRDRVLVNKVSYRLHDINRGDVVVFRRTDEEISRNPELPRDVIKRVIALPGETIEIKDNTVMIDGNILLEPYIDDGVITDDFGPQQVPLDHVFVMGDNRQLSLDSRFETGPVATDRVVGRAFFLFWPLNRLGSL